MFERQYFFSIFGNLFTFFSCLFTIFQKKITASQTHFAFTNIGSKMDSFRGTAIWNNGFWFGSPVVERVQFKQSQLQWRELLTSKYLNWGFYHWNAPFYINLLSQKSLYIFSIQHLIKSILITTVFSRNVQVSIWWQTIVQQSELKHVSQSCQISVVKVEKMTKMKQKDNPPLCFFSSWTKTLFPFE